MGYIDHVLQVDPSIHESFLDLVDYCIREFRDIADSKAVALSLSQLAKLHFSKSKVLVKQTNKHMYVCSSFIYFQNALVLISLCLLGFCRKIHRLVVY